MASLGQDGQLGTGNQLGIVPGILCQGNPFVLGAGGDCHGNFDVGEILGRKAGAERGREPSNAEIAADLEMNVDEVESIRRTSQAPVSLEKPVGDDDESEFGHFIEDETAPPPDEAADTAFRSEALTKCLASLSFRERRVLELRYGLNGERPRTLDEVGRSFNVTRERIRQIENQGLKKLRALADSQKLSDVA